MKKSPKWLIYLGACVFLGQPENLFWCLRQESNLYLALRRRSFYPLNYGGRLRFAAEFSHATQAGLARRPCYQRQDQIMSRAFSLPDWARKVKRCAIR